MEYERAPHRDFPYYAHRAERSRVASHFAGVMDMIMPWEDEDVVHGGAQGSYVPQPVRLEAEVKVEWYFERGISLADSR